MRVVSTGQVGAVEKVRWRCSGWWWSFGGREIDKKNTVIIFTDIIIRSYAFGTSKKVHSVEFLNIKSRRDAMTTSVQEIIHRNGLERSVCCVKPFVNRKTKLLHK
jgi:hypothetical protein